MQATALIRPGEIDQWDQALYAFLAEKERRSGSMRTVQSYSRMLQHFFGVFTKTPERITSPEVFSWAHGIGLSGKRPSSITIRRPPRLPVVVLQVPDPHGAHGR
jgi:hypothetical protein